MGNDSRGRPDPRVQVTLGPDGIVGLPFNTLCDEYRDTPEPEDSDRVPAPVPPSLVRRVINRLSTALRARGAGNR